jgi:glycosyltransferase involved in cell wall biosynthesis
MRGRPLIHLVNPLDQLGGSEMRTVRLYQDLRRSAEVHVWSDRQPTAAFSTVPIERIDVPRGRFPRAGTLVLVGVYFPVAHWLRSAASERVIIVYNTFSAVRLERLLAELASAGLPRAELVYASELLRRSIESSAAEGYSPTAPEELATASIRRRLGGPGVVHASPIDQAAFDAAWRARPRVGARPFVVGRMSRDTPEKFHPRDPELFRALAAEKCRVRLMGATTIADWSADPGIEVLGTGAEANATFLASLDAFVYRTSPTEWLESFGRVVHEAMYSGLPCVCERRGGYVDLIEHGRNGFLFDSDAEAVQAIGRLRDDAVLRARMGRAARETLVDLYSPRRRREHDAFYVRHASTSAPNLSSS